MPVITSRRNPVIKAAAGLSASAGSRREKRAFLCEGARLCKDAALSGLELRACFYTAQAREKYGAYLAPVKKASQEAYEIAPEVAALLSATKAPQGVFCVCGWPQGLAGGDAPLSARRLLVLEHIQDPGNLGTILRTAEALGGFGVYLLGSCCDPLSPKALRASMGAVFRLKIAQEPSPQGLAERLAQAGFSTWAAVPDRQARRVTEMDFSQGRHSLFIGNEGSGLTPETAGLCKGKLTIPMLGRAESLNAAAAATVLMWEMARGGER